MDRKEFLALVGTSIGVITLGNCLQSCQKQTAGITAPVVDFTLDLTAAANHVLTLNGGYLYNQGVIVARTMAGLYIAVSQACTHQGTAVTYNSSLNYFYCSAHGSSFLQDGTVTGGPAPSPLKVYTCTLTGTSLRVKG